jgi:hypothetical protein
MIELHDNACIRIDDTFAILGTVEGMANLTGAKPQELADNYRARRMALVWTTARSPNMTSRKPILIRFSRGTGWEARLSAGQHGVGPRTSGSGCPMAACSMRRRSSVSRSA